MRTLLLVLVLVTMAGASAQANRIHRNLYEVDRRIEKAEKDKAKTDYEAATGVALTNVLTAAYIDATMSAKNWTDLGKILNALAAIENAAASADDKKDKPGKDK